MNTKCSICKSGLELRQTGGKLGWAVHCRFCDERPDVLVRLLDKIAENLGGWSTSKERKEK